jgi:hypothetical protein
VLKPSRAGQQPAGWSGEVGWLACIFWAMKFKKQTCIYCQKRPSVPTGDHIFARRFFVPGRRGHLPKVPCCKECGDRKSRLEQYLMTVLPFGAKHADAIENLEGQVPRRLAKNKRLHRELNAGQSTVWVKQSSGLMVRAITLPIDSRKIEQLFDFTVRGLMWHHWQVLLGSTDFVKVILPNRRVERTLAKLSTGKATAEGAPGGGTFTYRGVQGKDNDAVSVWNFSIYGGVALTGDAPGETILNIRACTGPKRLLSAERYRPGLILLPR